MFHHPQKKGYNAVPDSQYLLQLEGNFVSEEA